MYIAKGSNCFSKLRASVSLLQASNLEELLEAIVAAAAEEDLALLQLSAERHHLEIRLRLEALRYLLKEDWEPRQGAVLQCLNLNF